MRYRALSLSGDYTFGQGGANFLINSPQAVAQHVLTRLKLLKGEWFLDSNEGMPWSTEVLGENTRPLYDQAIQQHVLNTPYVTGIAEYASVFDGANRRLSVSMTINTAFGATTITAVL